VGNAPNFPMVSYDDYAELDRVKEKTELKHIEVPNSETVKKWISTFKSGVQRTVKCLAYVGVSYVKKCMSC